MTDFLLLIVLCREVICRGCYFLKVLDPKTDLNTFIVDTKIWASN